MNPTTSALCAMGMACSNSVFIGYPVLLLTLPPVAGVAMALNTTLENIVVTPLMLALAEGGRASAGRWYRVIGRSLTRLFSNPMIIGLSAGFIISLCGWKLPQPIAQTLGLFAMTTGALSLFVIGSTLVGLPMGGMVRQVIPIVVGKLILHPLAVLLSLLVLPLAGIAIGGSGFETGGRPDGCGGRCWPSIRFWRRCSGRKSLRATALLITTIASFFTFSGLLLVLGIVPV